MDISINFKDLFSPTLRKYKYTTDQQGQGWHQRFIEVWPYVRWFQLTHLSTDDGVTAGLFDIVKKYQQIISAVIELKTIALWDNIVIRQSICVSAMFFLYIIMLKAMILAQ